MDKATFTQQMAITQSVFRTQLNSAASFEIWEAFKGWTDKQFIEAMTRCRRELDFFPSMRQIRQGYKPPAKKADKLEQHPAKGLLTDSVPASERKDPLDAEIDKMGVDTLRKHFATCGASPAAVESLVESHRKKPDRMLFRWFLKDCLRPGWEFSNLTGSPQSVKSKFAGDFDDWNKG